MKIGPLLLRGFKRVEELKLKLQGREREQSVSIESVLSVSGLEECCWCLRIESGSSTMKP